MGAGASVERALHDTVVTADCKKFIELHLDYTPTGHQAKLLRDEAWRSIDVNGNGHVSLAEVGKWIQESAKLSMVAEAKASDKGKGKTGKGHLSKAEVQAAKDEGLRLYKLFYPVYIRAFLDAADIGKNKKVGGTKTATTDDYVQRHEFRFLNVYLCIYALMYDAFAQVDGGSPGRNKDDDRRISESELKAAAGGFKGHPLLGVKMLGMPESYDNIGDIFKAMDADSKGMVLLKEWCQYLEAVEIEHQTKFGALLAYAEGTD